MTLGGIHVEVGSMALFYSLNFLFQDFFFTLNMSDTSVVSQKLVSAHSAEKDQLLIFISTKPFFQLSARFSGQSGCPLDRRCRPVRPCLIHCVDTRPSVRLHIHTVAVVRSASTPGRPSLRPVSSARRWRWSGKQVNALIPNGGSIQRRPSHACSSRFDFGNLQETRCSIPAQRGPRGVSDDGFDSVTLGGAGAGERLQQ